MKQIIVTSIVALGLAAPFALAAQEEEAAENYIYATYFYCDASRQEQADELVKKNSVPIYDAAVADGTISGWGWLAHHTGGKWRRLQYHTAPSLEALFKAQDVIGERMEAAGTGNDGFGAICSSHDDYIWKTEAGNTMQVKRGKAGLSVYEECDITREERADEIVKSVFAPVLEKAVADGKITSWGWSSHMVGGKYRRLSTMTGTDFAGLLKARGEFLDAVYGEDGENAEANEYADICGSHSDYLWEIRHENNG